MSKQTFTMGALVFKLFLLELQVPLIIFAVPLLLFVIFTVPSTWFNVNVAPTKIEYGLHWIFLLVIYAMASIVHLVYLAKHPTSDLLNKFNWAPRAKRIVNLTRSELCAGSLCFTTVCFHVLAGTCNLIPADVIKEDWSIDKHVLIANLPFFFVEALAFGGVAYYAFSAMRSSHQAIMNGEEWLLEAEELEGEWTEKEDGVLLTEGEGKDKLFCEKV